jgi:DNA ligase-1
MLEEPKLDGLRGVVIVRSKKDVKAYTSNGSLVVNARHITEAIKKEIATWGIFRGFVLDSEFFSTNWNESNSLVMTESLLANHKDLYMNTFDVISIKAWDKKQSKSPLKERKKVLRHIIKQLHCKYIKEVPYQTFTYTTEKELAKHLTAMIKKGYEGLMLKPVNGLYTFRRSRDWMKVKPIRSSTEDFKIIGCKEEKDKYGKLKGTLGSLKITGKVGKKKITTWCGGGYKKVQRQEFWKLHKQGKLIGLTAEVLFDNVTVGKALRFPRFKRLRRDKA